MGKKSSKSSGQGLLLDTTATNPYVTSRTTYKGTTASFNKGTAVDTINNFVNSNIGSLLNEYLNPTLNSVTNQAKLNSFMNALSNSSALAFENNIVNPLSKRNMIRSSQATDMYNKLAQNNANQISNYTQELLANSQKDTESMLYNLMLMYMNGYNILNDTQNHSLATSSGARSGSSGSSDSSDATQTLGHLAANIAMMIASA